MITVKTETQVEDKMISGLLCTAFEGGSNYWYMIEGEILASGFAMADFRKGGSRQDPDDYWHPCQLIPLAPGCSVLISDKEADDCKEHYKLNLEGIERGLQLMASDYQRHWVDFIGGNEDGDTGDVFLQLCLFGEIVYG